MTNEFLPFCPTNTGTNLLSQADYSAAADRTDGNQPGIASSKLNNKALRQSAYFTSQMAQFLANQTQTDILDNATPTQLLAQIMATLQPIPVNVTTLLSGSGTFGLTYVFFLASANATVGATYTNNGVTYTVKSTIAAGSILKASGVGAPTASGTLTKSGGTGDAAITFYAVRAPISLYLEAVAGGGGGSGSGNAPGVGGNGNNTTFGTTLIVCNAGTGATSGAQPPSGGAASLGTGPVGFAFKGADGQGGSLNAANTQDAFAGGQGGSSPFGGGGAGGLGSGVGTDGTAGTPNTGSGGGGGGGANTVDPSTGNGGGAGGWVRATITNVLASYAWVVGAGGAGGIAGSSGKAGGAGGSGSIYLVEHYQ